MELGIWLNGHRYVISEDDALWIAQCETAADVIAILTTQVDCAA
jgi:hypothetical protein